MKFKFKHFYNKPKLALPCAISGFRRDAHDICALLICYAACSGTSLPTFRDNLSVPSSWNQEIQKESGSFLIYDPLNGTDRLSRNVGKDVPLHAAKQTRAGISPYPTHKSHTVHTSILVYPASRIRIPVFIRSKVRSLLSSVT
jgi:hypothetical protein